MNEQQLKKYLITNYKLLLSNDAKEYYIGYNNLIDLLFKHDKPVKKTYINILQDWQTIQGITLLLIQGFINNNETELVKVIKVDYNNLKAKIRKKLVRQEDLQLFNICDERFNEKLIKLILK